MNNICKEKSIFQDPYYDNDVFQLSKSYTFMCTAVLHTNKKNKK